MRPMVSARAVAHALPSTFIKIGIVLGATCKSRGYCVGAPTQHDDREAHAPRKEKPAGVQSEGEVAWGDEPRRLASAE